MNVFKVTEFFSIYYCITTLLNIQELRLVFAMDLYMKQSKLR